MQKQLQEDEQHELHIKQDDESAEEAAELTFDDAMKLFNSSRTYIDSGFRTEWDKYFKVYKGARVDRNYDGIAEPVIRESHTIIETLVANIASGIPMFSFVRTNEEQSEETEVINQMMHYFMVCNRMGLKNQEWVREMLLYGTGVLGVEWRDGKPFIFNIPLRDFFFDPTSTGMVETLTPAQWAGYEYLADKEVLKRERIYKSDRENKDGSKGAWVPRYTGLDDLGPIPDAKGGKDGSAKGMDKAFKDMFKGSTLGSEATENQIHVIKLFHLPTGRIYEIGNKKKFIYNEPTWCQREEITRTEVDIDADGNEVEVTRKLDLIAPFLPFAILRDYIDSSQFLGAGEMELLLPDAELLNDYEAMQVDNNAYQNTPMYWVDPQFADLIPEIETIPGAVYPIPRNAMGVLERPQLTTDLDQKQDKILQRMRRSTAADEAVQGGSIGNSRTTATEVQTQMNQANLRFRTKISNLESEGYAQLANIIFKLVQIFITVKTAVRIVGPMGTTFRDYDPWEYNGEWEANALLDTTIKGQEVEVGLKDQSIMDWMKNNPIFNQIEVARWWIQKKDPSMTDDRFNKLLAPPASPDENANDKDYLQVSYKDLEPWGRYQAQKDLGWTPDPSLMGDMQNRMARQANEGVDLMDPATDANGNVIPGADKILNPDESQPQPTPAMLPA
jgi:hypothetical protein